MVDQKSPIRGTHFVAELAGCDRSILDDANELEAILIKSIEQIDADVVERLFHRFRPDGVTGCVMSRDAHITIHTWPDAQYASIDLYSTEDHDEALTLAALARGLSADTTQTLLVERGGAEADKIKVKGHRRVKSYTIDCRGDRLPETVRVGNSTGRGLGLFAARDFSDKELIYESRAFLAEWDAEFLVKTDHGNTLHDADSLGYELRLPLVDLWSEQVRHSIEQHHGVIGGSSLDILKWVTGEGQREVMMTGFDGLINHSNSPNVEMEWSGASIDFDEKERPVWFVPTRALRSLKPGEELFVDYRVSLFDFVPPAHWLD